MLKKPKVRFSWAPNNIINDPTLSLKSKGLWLYVNSKPETWDFSISGTQAQNKEGRDSIRAAVKELEEAGYLKRKQGKDKSGHFTASDWILYDTPGANRNENLQILDVKTDVGKTDVGKPDDGKTNTSKTDNSKTEEEAFINKSICSKDIIEIIDYLNKKTGRTGAQKYSTKSKATRGKIKARINEGFTVEDFKIVIDNMVSKWLNDSKMKDFLRPETLFSPKFESYKNIIIKNPEKLNYDYDKESSF